jgi:hypothetical protein
MPDLAERVQHVRLLLDTLDDPYPPPGTALRPDSGPAPSRYVPCETCRRAGELRVRGGWQLCLLCDGRGWRRRERDEEEWDAYIELPLTEASQLPVPIKLKAPPPPGIEESYAWERDRRRYDRHGSYGELRVQLDRLGIVRPRRYWLVRTVLVEHDRRALEAPEHVQLDLGVLQLALWMRSVRVPGWLIERTKADERRETLAELAATGMPAGQIARLLGLPKEAVVRRLRRRSIDSKGAGVPATAT